jgi:predicted transcriptional regulator of viral defense system
MEFDELLSIVGDEPVFETGLLLAGDRSPGYVRRQLSGWVDSGRLWQLRRGLYALAPPYQQAAPHPFLVANRLVSGSYVSLQSALAYYGMIPEHVAVVTSVTTARPGEWETPLGAFLYRHIRPGLFYGYRRVELVMDHQRAFVASPAKALLDTVYLQPGGDSRDYLASLRLQNLDQLDQQELRRLADEAGKPKLLRAADAIRELAAEEGEGYEPL